MRLVATTSAWTWTGSAIRGEPPHHASRPQRSLVDERGVALQEVGTRREAASCVVDARDAADPDEGEVGTDPPAQEAYDVLRPLGERPTAEPSRADPLHGVRRTHEAVAVGRRVGGDDAVEPAREGQVGD